MTAREPELHAEDQQVLGSLRRAGSDLSLPHPIHHYLYFPKEAAARRAAKALRAEGYDVRVRLGADEVNWLVLASRAAVPEPEAVAATTSWMENLAALLGGEYDGWEAEVVR